MANPVKIMDIVEGMEGQIDDYLTFLHVKTGEVLLVNAIDLRDAEEIESIDDLSEELAQAVDLLENGNDYIELPTKYEINDYQIMEDFCYSIHDEQKKSELLNAIRGKGAFRRFKDKVEMLGLLDEWYQYRNAQYKAMAVQWCKDHGIEYTDEKIS